MGMSLVDRAGRSPGPNRFGSFVLLVEFDHEENFGSRKVLNPVSRFSPRSDREVCCGPIRHAKRPPLIIRMGEAPLHSIEHCNGSDAILPGIDGNTLTADVAVNPTVSSGKAWRRHTEPSNLGGKHGEL